MDKKWDEKQNKYRSIPDKHRIPRKLTKKILSVSVNTDYGNMIPQIWKGAEQNKKTERVGTVIFPSSFQLEMSVWLRVWMGRAWRAHHFPYDLGQFDAVFAGSGSAISMLLLATVFNSADKYILNRSTQSLCTTVYLERGAGSGSTRSALGHLNNGANLLAYMN